MEQRHVKNGSHHEPASNPNFQRHNGLPKETGTGTVKETVTETDKGTATEMSRVADTGAPKGAISNIAQGTA